MSIKIKTASHGPVTTSILIIYTGGTLGMAYDKGGNLLKPFDFSKILDRIPELNRFEVELTFISFDNPLDSSNFQPEHWLKTATIIEENYALYDGFVILHGTDTMAYSASALSFLLENLNKPVIFTGAQLPIGIARTDARENIITSIEIASAKVDGRPLISEVCIFFHNILLRGNRSKKVQSNHFDAFISENYPVLAEAGVTIDYNFRALRESKETGKLTIQKSLNTDVAILKLFPGIEKKYVEALFKVDGIQGVVLETFGSGNAMTDKWFIDLLKSAINSGVLIYNVSQCLRGKVLQGKYQTSSMLKDIGVISGGNITTEAAITKLMYIFGSERHKGDFKSVLEAPLAGEMD